MYTMMIRHVARREMSTYASTMQKVLSSEIGGIHEAGTYKTERVITSPQSSQIRVAATESSTVPEPNEGGAPPMPATAGGGCTISITQMEEFRRTRRMVLYC